MSDIEMAKDILTRENLNFVLVKDGKVIEKSDAGGIRPVLEAFKRNSEIPCGASAADRVIGRAAAIFLRSLKISELYTDIISEDGEKILKEAGVLLSYEKKVEKILNRDQTDMCPMEKLSQNEEDAHVLKEKIEEFFRMKN